MKVRDNREKEYQKWQIIYDKSKCSSLDEFLQLPAETLFRLIEAESKGLPGYCTSIYDDAFGSEARKEPCDTKIMIGITSEDVFPLLLYHFSNVLVKSQQQKNIPSYRYYFQRKLPGDTYGAWHGSDLWYCYGTLDKCWRPFTKADYELADLMQRYIARFVTCGDPNGEGDPNWLVTGSGKKDFMIFDSDGSRMGHPGLCKLIKGTFFRKYPGI